MDPVRPLRVHVPVSHDDVDPTVGPVRHSLGRHEHPGGRPLPGDREGARETRPAVLVKATHGAEVPAQRVEFLQGGVERARP